MVTYCLDPYLAICAHLRTRGFQRGSQLGPAAVRLHTGATDFGQRRAIDFLKKGITSSKRLLTGREMSGNF